MHPGFAIGLVFLGCTSNVVFLELLARDFPGCGNIVTFGQFLFIALEGLIFQAHFLTKPRAIPLRNYFTMVSMFFVVSVVNNYALNFNIPMPLHMIFRSGSLIASMVLGIIILKKRYTVAKYISIALVSLGIFICTFMSAKQVSSRTSASDDDGYYLFIQWLIGIAMLTFALFMSARMGLFQETLYKRYGKHPKEALFYNHFLPLPAFLLFASDIYNHGVLFSQSNGDCTPGSDFTNHVVLLGDECSNSICLHPWCFYPHDRMHIPDGHARCYTSQVHQPNLLHCLLQESLHLLALVWDLGGLYWDPHLCRSLEKVHATIP
ncbi:UDP-xylose and UDP-N-acetylglucosamine transporter isoform X3 [Carcharodon carcharias]|uniref:UDP-xylose and UDP-N-acetylglucosamine transporter isoform X3 n=1 Tax=Carcharodon carcharias TaxID=13397 RepID=UPI001B7F1EA1|nr:UDP-xylose and UDP-N-acetylglucosamine transporter isoform X3 [Carcharodon carcharias]